MPHHRPHTGKSKSGITGHPDHNELLNYFRATGGRKSKVYLVHGEKE
ncbi:MAG: hypothetical protein IJX33_02870 [Akkermansia sp.]|nr:hypothetical protein [Akkermansia sp.]